MVDDGHAVAELVGLFHVVGGEDDGDSLFAQAADGVPHGDAALWIEAGAGFVEEEHFGVMGDGAGDLDTLREAAGELRRIGTGALREMKLREELVGALLRLYAGEAEVKTMEVDVFEDGAGAIERVVLWHNTDISTGHGWRCDYVNSCDVNFAECGQGTGGADANRGGFSGAVGAEQTEEFALAHAKVDSVYSDYALLALVYFLKTFNLYDHYGFSPRHSIDYKQGAENRGGGWMNVRAINNGWASLEVDNSMC